MDVELIEIRDFLAAQPPFGALPAELLERLPGEVSVRYLRRGSPFPPADADQPYLYVVRTGAVELRDRNDELVDKIGEGGLYTGLCAPDSPETTLQGVVVEDSLFYLIDCERVAELRKAHPDFDRHFADSVRERLRHALESLQEARTTTQGLTRTPAAELVHRRPATIPPETSIQEAARRMTEEGVSALLVVDRGRLAGLITDHDLRTRCIAQGLSYERPVSEIMTRELLTVGAETAAFEALLIMTRRDIHHLPVLRGEELVGVISTTDLIRYQSANAVYLARDVRRSESVEAIAQLSARLPEMHVQLVASGATAHQIGQTLSSVVEAMTVRLIEFAEQRLGPPPLPYAWLAVGSLARREQAVHSDQDNALIYADGAGEADAEYFEALARYVNDGLNACGIPYCPGQVMASNPQWRRSLTGWCGCFEGWIARPDRRGAMLASNFFDMRTVYGDDMLLQKLFERMRPRARDNKIFLAYMASDALQNRPPLGFFRNFVVIGEGEHANSFDLKHRGVIPIVDLARFQALSAALPQLNTQERLQAAARHAGLSPEGAANLQDALEFISTLRARHQAAQIKQGLKPDNYIAPEDLSSLERSHLKDAFEVIVTVQKALAQRYQVGRLV